MNDDDLQRLAEVTEILYWQGRYGAPTRDENLEKAVTRFEKHQRTELLGCLTVITVTPFDWDDFERLYSMANEKHWELEHERRGKAPHTA